MARPTSGVPSLWPKEHGAYFQLALPQLTALGLGWPTALGLLFTAAATLAFLGHAPLLVALGRRGKRATEAFGDRAKIQAALLLASAAATGITGLALGSDEVRFSAMVPLAFALVVGALVVRGKEKTIVGEILVGLAFATALLPVALANGVALAIAMSAAGVWALGFATATLAVHAVLSTIKKDRPWARPLALAAALMSLGLAASPLVLPSASAGVSALALSGLAGLAIVVMRVHPRRLRRVGWSLAATHALTLGLLIAAMRA